MHRALGVALAPLLMCLAAGSIGCHKTVQAEAAPASDAPPGQAWLTAQQVTEGHIVVQPLAEQDVDDTILSSGRVTFDDQRVAHVFSPVTGRVARIDANLGERIKRGQPLAVITSPDIGQASSDLGKADADMIAAEHDFNRKKELFADHAASQADYETAEDNYRKAKAERERAYQKAFLLRTGNVDSVSQGYTLASPIEGELIARNVNPGIEVQGQYGGGQAVELFTVGELDRVWVLADVYEMDLARVKVGAHVSVKVIAYPGKQFDGRVDWVSGALDPQSRTAKVRCTFENPDRLLKPEMYATVSISVEEKRALALPKGAVLRLGDATVVFIEVGKTPDGRVKFERLPVKVDEGEGSQWLPVEHGLDKGTPVVTQGAILLAGMI
ncbi:MAG TPA: efflux RND transporter periplasmic adaptor subunit [Polyangiaceae bacterium]|jgi:cobalt-zinc-cadmium efflux system membrane fusion protein